LCGGSGFYIKAVIEGLQIPKVPPDWKFRKKLEKKSAKELYEKLKKLDPERAKTIDPKNKRRLIRALEIIKKLKKVPKLKKIPPPYKILIIGIKKSKKQLKILIKKRLKKRLKKGLIAEVKKLRKYGLSFKRLKEFGLEYKWVALYLEKKISYQEMVKNLLKDIERFAKKQISFFKKLKGVKWVKNYKEAQNLVRRFLLS
jgi:tRNA dimethylallyltransferase